MIIRTYITNRRYHLLLLFFITYLVSCGHSSCRLKKNHPFPLHYTEKGIASWYGKDFHGRKTANGEIYDMYKYTAAHRFLPLGCHVKVTNLKNQKSVMVRVNDRGPFIKGRILDLSYMAARELDIVEDGIAPIKLEVVQLPKHQKSAKYFIQVGAFSNYENAKRMNQKLSSQYSTHFTKYQKLGEQEVYRVRIGPYTQLDLLKKNLGKLKTKGFVDSFIVAE